MGVLFIGDDAQTEINAMIERARANPLPWAESQKFARTETPRSLKMDEVGEEMRELRKKYPVQQLILGTYLIAFSFEEVPEGMNRHLSISTTQPGMVPSPQVVAFVAMLFGFPPDFLDTSQMWMEEYAPDHNAINVKQLELK